MSSVREYVILYLNGKAKTGGSATIGGGNAVLSTNSHALGGPEHTGQLAADRVAVTDAGDYFAADEAESVLQELGAADVAIEADIDALEAAIDALGAVWVPVMASAPNVVTTDGSALWVPLTLEDGSPVMIEMTP